MAIQQKAKHFWCITRLRLTKTLHHCLPRRKSGEISQTGLLCCPVQVISICLITLTLTGCGDLTLQRLTDELARTGTGCSVSISSCYQRLDEANHKMDEDELKLRGLPELVGVNLPNPGDFTAKFGNDVIQPRVRVANLVEAYCSNLNDIVNTKKMAAADQTVVKFNGVLNSIGSDLLHVSAIGSKLPLSTINALTEPVKTLASLGLQGGLAVVRENWAKETIQKRAIAIEDVCTNFVRDLKNSIEVSRDRARNIAHLKQKVLEAKIKKGISNDEKNQLISDIVAEGKFADSLTNNDPRPVFSHLKDVVEKLRQWAIEKDKMRNYFFVKGR